MSAPAITYLNQKEKPKREGFKWGQELLKWKTAHAELQKRYEDLVSKTLEENEGFLGEVRKSGYKDGHSDGYMEAEEKTKKENEELKEENDEWNRQFEECELVLKENVLCSYDDVDDYIWNRVKNICHEDIPPKYQPLFDGNDFIRGFKGVSELKAENENLKNEIWKERENTCFAEEAIEQLEAELEELKSHISTPSLSDNITVTTSIEGSS